MKKIAHACVLLAGLAACQTTDNVARDTAVTLPVLQKPELAVGDNYTYYRNGAYEVATVTAKGEDTYSFEIIEGDGTGCTYTGEAFLSPDIEWADCEGSTGTQTLTKTGNIWPLAVGNTESYSGKGTDGKDSWSVNRDCRVAGTATVTLGTNAIPAYEVVCKDGSNTRTWYYSEDHKWPLKYTKVHKKRGLVDDRELDLGQPAS